MHFNSLSALLVLYNPDKEIFTNIASYIQTVDKLYVIDNSSETKPAFIKKISEFSEKIEYSQNSANLGIATALNQGCKKAIIDGYAWILTMDQDSCFQDITRYLKCADTLNELEQTAIISPSIDIQNAQETCLFQEKDVTITSGSLLNLNLFTKIGGFEEKLFIDEVDHDYCLKAKLLNLKIIQFTNILLMHKIGEKTKLTSLFLRRKKLKNQHNAQRLYYQTRNRLYMWKKFGKTYPQYFKLSSVLYRVIYKKIFKIISWEENKIKKISAIFHGVRDFLKEQYGEYKQ